MRSHIVCSLIAIASLLGGAAAGPCKPLTTVTLSTSATEDSSSSTSEATSSIAVDTTSSLTLDTTLSSATDDASSLTTSNHVSTSTDITLSTSTDDASSTTTETTISLTSTTEATASTTETTSSLETSSSTTEVSTTTTEAATTTSDAPSVGPTFALQEGTTGYGIYLTLGASSESLYSVGDFHIETSTSRLMLGDVYASIGTSSAGLLVAQTVDSVAATNYRFLSCTPPVQLGQKLECVVKGTSRTQFYVSSNEQTNTPIYLTAPGSPPGIAYTTFDLIV
ncbi:hypothetical protein FDECE_18505, partial [Fusarium decemcellulare]